MAFKFNYTAVRRRLSCLQCINKLLGHSDRRSLHTNLSSHTLQMSSIKASPCNLLVKIIAAQYNTLASIRNKALLSLEYDSLARRSELVTLRIMDLEFTEGGALKGMIRKSKTDQYERGRLFFGSERSAKLLWAWFRKEPKEIEPVFCAINHGQCMDRSICDRNMNKIIKKSVMKVKYCERPSDLKVSGHPLLVGAA